MNISLFKTYVIRFIFRIAVLVFGCILYFNAPNLLDIDTFDFFSSPSLTHVIWLILMLMLLYNFFPKAKVSVGAQKYKKKYYSAGLFNREELKDYRKKTNKKALVIAIVWILFNTPFWILYLSGIISSRELLILVLLFGVADLFCVLLFCPFQKYLKNKCCKTCRIFVWDHIFLVTPLIVVPGFFSKSLVIVGLISFIIWEIQGFRHPEYFYEKSNSTLKCNSCKEALCKIKKRPPIEL